MTAPFRVPRLVIVALAVLASLTGVLVSALPPGDEGSPFPDNWYLEGGAVLVMRHLEGERAHEITGVKWLGDPQSLRELRGRIVVLDFWAAWCPPCGPTLKLDAELQRQFGDKGVTVLGIHDGSAFGKQLWDAGTAQQMAADRGVTFPIGLDSGADDGAMAQYDVRFFPACVVVDRQGIVRAAGVQPERVRDVVEALLARADAPGPLAEFPPELYAGGESRLSTLRAIECQAAPPLVAEEWIGAPVHPEAGTGLTVLHFFSSTNVPSMEALRTLVSHKEELAAQGAVIVAVDAAQDDWASVRQLAETEKWGISIARDAPAVSAAGGQGQSTSAFGVAIFCPTLIVDQRGLIRAAGLRPERVLDAARHIALNVSPTLMKSPSSEHAGTAR